MVCFRQSSSDLKKNGGAEVGRSPRSVGINFHQSPPCAEFSRSYTQTKTGYPCRKSCAVKMKVGTLNCQGLIQQSMKKQQLADDIEKYRMEVLAIQQTHLKESGVETITSSSGKKMLFTLFRAQNEVSERSWNYNADSKFCRI